MSPDLETQFEALHRLIQLCRRNGMKEFKGMGFELIFAPQAIEPRKAKPIPTEKTPRVEELSNEERQEFFWWMQTEKEEDEVDFGKS